MNDSKPTIDSKSSKSIQFRLSTIFVVTSVATILAAYLSPRGDDLLLAGLVTTTASAFFGFVVGYFNRPVADRVFWGVVAAAMMQAVCATAYLIDRTGIVAWPLASGFAAVIVAKPINRYRRMFFGALTAGLIIGVYSLMASDVLLANDMLLVSIANTACAAIGGALLALLVEVVQSVQGNRRVWQPMIGLAFVSAAIAFSLLAPRVIPGW